MLPLVDHLTTQVVDCVEVKGERGVDSSAVAAVDSSVDNDDVDVSGLELDGQEGEGGGVMDANPLLTKACIEKDSTNSDSPEVS